MCEPSTIALAGIALGTGLGVIGDVAGHKAQQAAAEANRKAAQKNFQFQIGDIQSRRSEEEQAASLKSRKATEISTGEKSSAKASAAEGGVSGSSVTAQQQDLTRSLSEFLLNTKANRDLRLRQLDRSAEGASAEFKSRVAGVPQPSTFATGLRIGGRLATGATSAFPFFRSPT